MQTTDDADILEGEVVDRHAPHVHKVRKENAPHPQGQNGCSPGCLIFLAGFIVALIWQNLLIFAIGVVLALIFLLRPPAAR